jgi:DNA-binding SARP family transcriptional activator
MRNGEKNGKAMSASLQIRLLGTPRITLDGAPVTGLSSAKAQGLLFYLAVTGRIHTRPALAGLMWGDFPEAAARANLRKALQQLRQEVGAYLVIEQDMVALAEDADCWVDAVEFDTLLRESTVDKAPERVRRGIDLYRGDFLEGFYVRGAPDFENWWLAERARLREMMLEDLHTLADHHAKQGNLDDAIALSRRFVALEPWREQAHRRLMTWLALSGQRGAALAQYELCRRVLADELGVEPAQETTALFERIRDGDLRPPPVSGARLLDIEPLRPAFLDETVEILETGRESFVGRESQLARLEESLETVLVGRGQVAFVSGEAGWGKTRLLSEFSRRAQEGHPHLIVASGICTTIAGAGDPYLPFREILRMLCADVEQEWAAGSVTHGHVLRLWRFLPVVVEALRAHGRHLLDTFVPAEALLRRAAAHDRVESVLLERVQRLIDRGPDRSQEAGMDQGRIFQEVADLLHALSRDQPLLLILDDLHWADGSSLSLLFHLGRRLVECPILILGAYRPEDISLGREGRAHPLVGVLDEFKRLFGDVWVNLGQDEAEGRGFVDALLDSEPNRLGEGFRARLAQNTKGHPLFTVEILRDLKEQGVVYRDESGRWVESPTLTWGALPKRVEGVIERRINRLAPQLRETLVTASVEGEEFTAEVVARVCGVDETDMVGRLSGDLAKSHHLVRAAGVRSIGKERISRYSFAHNLFQEYLYHTLDSVQRAYLHEAVGKTLEMLYQGHTEEIAGHLARHFLEAGRPATTVEYLKQAGDAAARVHANTEAISHYSQAIDLACQIDADAEDLTLLYTRLGRALELDSQFDRVLTTYEAMEELAQQRGNRRMELASLMARATIQSVPSAIYDSERARVLGERALSLAGELSDRTAEARILWSLSLANYFTDRLSEAIRCGERSLALARELGLREQMARTLNDLGGMIYLYSGRIDQAREALEEAGELWRQLGDRPMQADSLSGSCIAHVYAGEYDRAIALSEQAFQISQTIGNLWGQSYSRWTIGDVYRERGEFSRAIEVSEACIRQGELAGFVASQTYTRARLAAVYGDLGAVERGTELIKVALTLAEEHSYRVDTTLVLGVLARLQVLKGDLPEAEATVGQAKKEAFHESWAVFYLAAISAEAELALRLGDYHRAMVATDDLLGRLRTYGMRSRLPEALYLQGQALLGLRQEEAARERFVEARAAAETVGSRRILWPVLCALGRVERDLAQAASLRQRAREVVLYIADHILQEDLRAVFINLPDVRAVFGTAGSE